MGTQLLSGAACLLFVLAVAFRVVQDMLQQEVHVRLHRLPYAITRLAAHRVSPDLRDEIHQYWRHELAHRLSDDADEAPVTRLLKAISWALSLLLRQAGPRTAEAFHAHVPPFMTGFEDIRQLSRKGRRQFASLLRRLHDVRGLSVDRLDDGMVHRLVKGLLVAAEALVADREERAALELVAPIVENGHPLAARLGREHVFMLDLRRVYAHALLQLDDPRAEGLLGALLQEEIELFGYRNRRALRTETLHWWARSKAGHHEEAEAGLIAIEGVLRSLPRHYRPLHLHAQCKRSWIQGELGKAEEALSGYRQVVSGRSTELGISHADTLDAQHSMGKMLVQRGEGGQAVDLLRLVYGLRRRLQGRHHADTLETKKYLALARAQIAVAPRVLVRWWLRHELAQILAEQVGARGAETVEAHDTMRWLTILADPMEKP